MPTLSSSSSVTLALRATLVVSGVVHASPASGFTLSVAGNPWDNNTAATTGADGAYRLRLPSGSYTMSISSSGQTQATSDRPDHWYLTSQSFDVTANRTLDLTPGFAH